MGWKYPNSYRYTCRDFDEVAKRYLAGAALRDAAGVMSMKTAHRFLTMNGLTRSIPEALALRRAQRAARVESLRRCGLTIAEAARRLGVSKRQAFRYVASTTATASS